MHVYYIVELPPCMLLKIDFRQKAALFLLQLRLVIFVAFCVLYCLIRLFVYLLKKARCSLSVLMGKRVWLTRAISNS